MALKIPASLVAGADVTNYDDTEVKADIATLSLAISNLTTTIDGRIAAKVKSEALIEEETPAPQGE